MKVPLLIFVCCVVTAELSEMDKLAQEMFAKLKEEHGIDTPEGEDEIRSLIMNAQEHTGGGGQQPPAQESADFMDDTTETVEEPEEMVIMEGNSDVIDDTTASECEQAEATDNSQCIPREKYEKDLYQLRNQMTALHKSLSHSVSREQYDRDISQLKAHIGNQGTGQTPVDFTQLNTQMTTLQESLQFVLRKLRSYDSKIEDLTTEVSALNDNYAKNTVRKCQSGRFTGCECSKCCGHNTWNCDGTKEIFYTEAFHKAPAITISVGSFKKTKNIAHPIISYDIGKDSFKLQYLPKDNFVDLEEVQVNWIACA